MTAAATTQQAPKQAQPPIPVKKTAAKKKVKAKKKTGTAVAIHKPQPPAVPKTFLQAVMEAARDPKCDVAKMKELLEIAQEQEARRVLNPLILAIHNACPPVVADSLNSHTKSKWAKLEKVSAALDPLMKQHGLSISWGMADSPINEHYRVIGDLLHSSGAQRRYFLDAPSDALGPKGSGNKSAVQGIGSTISYIKRYLKIMIFDVPIIGEDNDGVSRSPIPLSAIELKNLKEAIKFAEADVDKFCAHFQIDSVEQLPKPKLEEAMRLLAQKAGK